MPKPYHRVGNESVFSLLPTDIKRQSSVDDLHELDISANKELCRRRFYKLRLNNEKCIHLTLGKDLDKIYNLSVEIHKVLPNLSCRPLFFEDSEDFTLFGQEYFDGDPIDKCFEEDRLSENDVTTILTTIEEHLQKLESPSSDEALLHEYHEFSERILNNPLLQELDKEFLKLYILPSLKEGVKNVTPSIRWSPGDLTPRNILVDANLSFRIIDFEFASKTHFHFEDWVRLHTFSSAKLGNIKFLQDLKQKYNWWWQCYLYLRQTYLNRHVHAEEACKKITCRDLVNSFIDNPLRDVIDESRTPLVIEGITSTVEEVNLKLAKERESRTDIESLLTAENQKYLDTRKELKLVQLALDDEKSEVKSLQVLIQNEKEKKSEITIRLSHAQTELEKKKEKLLFTENILAEEIKNKLNAESKLVSKSDEVSQKDLEIVSTIEKLNSEIKIREEAEIKLQESELQKISLKWDLEVRDDKIRRMQDSFSWKITSPVRFLRRVFLDTKDCTSIRPKFCKLTKFFALNKCKQTDSTTKYLEFSPLVSIIMPVYRTRISYLKKAIESVLSQAYGNFELCIANDNSTDDEIDKLLSIYQKIDSRVKVLNRSTTGGISQATMSAISIANGEYIGFLDHDDCLHPEALLEVVTALNKNKALKIIYTDEDKIIENGSFVTPYYKPDWNLNLFLSQNYICHFVVICKYTFDKYGCFRSECDGAQDWDNLLHIIPKIKEKQIHHIDKVLYHWRIHKDSTALDVSIKSSVITASLKALNDYGKRESLAIEVKVVEQHYFNLSYKMPKYSRPLVTIIIPTKDNHKILKKCLESLRENTDYNNYRIIVVNNSSTEKNTIKYLESLSENIILESYGKDFNHSAINNYIVNKYESELYLFLNDDTEFVQNNWLSCMVASIHQKCAGVVGCKLLYPSRKVQHAGVVIGIGDFAGHAFKHLPENASVMGTRLHLKQNYSAVTAACMLVKGEVFKAVNGFDEINLPTSYNDVDLCLRIGNLNHKIIYEPVTVIHHESLTRGVPQGKRKLNAEREAVQYMRKKWRQIYERDPNYNRNLTRKYEDFSH